MDYIRGVRLFQPKRRREWYSTKDIDDLQRKVKVLDILQLELSNEPPHYGWSLVIGSGNDLEIVHNFQDKEIRDALLREVIGDRRIRINNSRVSLSDMELDYNEATTNNIFHVMAHFLSNRPMTNFICSLEDEFRELSGEPGEDTKPKVQRLIEVALTHLIGLAGRGLEGKAERNIRKVSDWFNKNRRYKRSNRKWKELESELCVGDMMEFKRLGDYNHWGIFLGKLGGNLLVLHFSIEGSGKNTFYRESCAEDKLAYRIDSIEKPLGKRSMRINNELDRQWPPLKPDGILDGIVHRLASQTLQKPSSYSVLRNSCEHLVNELRYIKHHCEQLPPILGPLRRNDGCLFV